jgi:hypothetical protein
VNVYRAVLGANRIVAVRDPAAITSSGPPRFRFLVRVAARRAAPVRVRNRVAVRAVVGCVIIARLGDHQIIPSNAIIGMPPTLTAPLVTVCGDVSATGAEDVAHRTAQRSAQFSVHGAK